MMELTLNPPSIMFSHPPDANVLGSTKKLGTKNTEFAPVSGARNWLDHPWTGDPWPKEQLSPENVLTNTLLLYLNWFGWNA